MNNMLATFIAVPLGVAFLIPLLYKAHRRLPDILGNLSTLYLMAASVFLYFVRPVGSALVQNCGGFPAPIGINLVLDGFSHFMLLTVNLVAFFITVYSVSYMEKYTEKRKYYGLLMMMVAGMNGAILTGDLLNFFIFLELAAISSAVLVAFGTESDELEASFKYLVMGTIASVFILFAIVLIYCFTGSTSMADVALKFPAGISFAKTLIMLLLITGLSTKAALVPFHAWLPDAHPAAPAPISAMLSGVLIKALGIYGLTRIFFNVLGISSSLSYILMVMGVISMLAGVLLALGQWDLKRLLAYHSISQVGYVILGIGLATPFGILSGLFHLFNHAIFKPLLFLNSGAIEYATGSRQLKELGGLRKVMPVTYGTSLAASLAISGIPPFNGFWSKLFVIIACVQSGKLWFAAAAVLGSILTLSSFMKVQKYAFNTDLPPKLASVKEAPAFMCISMVMLALVCLLVGILFPYFISFVITPAAISVASGKMYALIVLGGR